MKDLFIVKWKTVLSMHSPVEICEMSLRRGEQALPISKLALYFRSIVINGET